MSTLTTSVPHFSLTFTLGTTNTLLFTDLITTNYASLSGFSAMKGIIRIKDPDSIIFYQGTGYDEVTPNWSSPDINSSTSTWTKGRIALPLDSDGNVKRGTYTVDYLVTIDSSSFVQVTKSYDFEYVAPVIDITHTVDCGASTLTSTDATDYDIVIGGTVISPDTTTRSHTVKEPLGSGFTPTPGTTTDVSRVIGGGSTSATRLWTKIWQTSVSTVVGYTLAEWDGLSWIFVADTLTGYKSTDVECDDCGCVMRTCFTNLINEWVSAEEGNKKTAWDLRIKSQQAIAYWIEYEQAITCGEDATSACNALKDILASVDCSCDGSNDEASHVIVPISASTGSGTASTFNFGYGTGTPSGGNSDDMYLRNKSATEQYIYRNISGTWTLLFNIVGATGTGTPGTDGASGVQISSDQTTTATSAGTMLENLFNYALDTRYWTKADDCAYATFNLTLGLNDNGKTIYPYINSTQVGSYFTNKLIDDDNKYVKVEMWITWVDSSNVWVEVQFTTRDGIVTTSKKYAVAPSGLEINLNAENSTATSSDIVYQNSRIAYLIQAPALP